MTQGLLLAATCLGAVLYLRSLASTLRLGDANIRGVLLLPSLPTPLYVTMALVVVVGVGLTLLVGMRYRRRHPEEPQIRKHSEAVKTPWQVLLSMIVSGAFLLMGLIWLIRHGAQLQQWWTQWRDGIKAAPGLLTEGTRSWLRQVESPTAGYALFVVVLIIYGGLAVLALWVLFGRHDRAFSGREEEPLHTRRVRRAVTAGLRELHQHTNPRQAIIACYARLEHLLEDYGVPAHHHLTPQEYMGVALQGLNLPLDAFAGLVHLFEQARYSLHPLDERARTQAITYLETLQTHLEWGSGHAEYA
jgi:hypothetical protein